MIFFFEKSLKYVSFAQMIVLNTISENETKFKGLWKRIHFVKNTILFILFSL